MSFFGDIGKRIIDPFGAMGIADPWVGGVLCGPKCQAEADAIKLNSVSNAQAAAALSAPRPASEIPVAVIVVFLLAIIGLALMFVKPKKA